MPLPVHTHRDNAPSLEGTYEVDSAQANSETHLEFLPEELPREPVFIIEPVSSAPSRNAAQRWPEDQLFAIRKVPADVGLFHTLFGSMAPLWTRLGFLRVLDARAILLVLHHGAVATLPAADRAIARSVAALRGGLHSSRHRPVMRISLSMPDISRARFPVANPTLLAFTGGTAIGAVIMWLVGALPAPPRLADSGVTLMSGVAATELRSNDRVETVKAAAPVTTPIAPQETAPEPVSAAMVVPSPAITVTSAPAGARVTVDGIGWGETPVTIQHLSSGPKVIRVTKEGYESQQRTIRVLDDRRSAAVRITLRARN